jgi:hypothetical protein
VQHWFLSYAFPRKCWQICLLQPGSVDLSIVAVIDSFTFAQALKRRIDAIRKVLWNERCQQWVDFHVNKQPRYLRLLMMVLLFYEAFCRNENVGVLSNFAPLWAGCWHADINFTAVLEAFRMINSKNR